MPWSILVHWLVPVLYSSEFRLSLSDRLQLNKNRPLSIVLYNPIDLEARLVYRACKLMCNVLCVALPGVALSLRVFSQVFFCIAAQCSFSLLFSCLNCQPLCSLRVSGQVFLHCSSRVLLPLSLCLDDSSVIGSSFLCVQLDVRLDVLCLALFRLSGVYILYSAVAINSYTVL